MAVTENLTFNLGVRFEYQHAFLPEQSKPVTPGFPTLFPAGTYPYLSVQKWYSAVPRFGVAWSLNPRTVLKASYGRYNGGMESGFAGIYNPNGQATATFRWRDLDGNKDYTPGEVNLNLQGPDWIF